MSKDICQFQKEDGRLFRAQEIFRVIAQSGFIQKDSAMDKACGKNVNVMERYHEEKYNSKIQKDRPEMIKGLTPYQILGKLTCQTQKRKIMKFAGEERIDDDRSAVISWDP